MDTYGSFKKYFDINYCLLRLFEEIKTPFIESSVEDTSKSVLCFLFGQLRNTYESVIILCRSGFCQQGYALLRSLQEGFIRISYILHKGEKETIARAREWAECEAIERKNMLESVKKSKGLDSEFTEGWLKQEGDILKRYKEIRQKKMPWPKKESMECLCNEVDLPNEYLLYRNFSSRGHLSPRSALDQVTVKGHTISYRWGPKREKEIASVLRLAHRYYLLILVWLSLYFGVKPNQKLRWHIELRRDLPDDIKKLLKLRFDICIT